MHLLSKFIRRRMTRLFLLFTGIGYVMLVTLFVRFQERLIFPGSLYRGAPFTRFTPRTNDLLLQFSLGEDTLVGFWKPAENPKLQTLTVLYFYGNGSCLATTQDNAEVLHSLGVNVMMIDYPGYGMSSGKPSEVGTVSARNLALAYLQNVQKIPSQRLIFMGSSLGGAVAIRAASENPCAGLITLCTFTSMGDMAAKTLPLLPFKNKLLRHPFDSLTHLEKVTCPVLFIHGTKDRMVSFSMRDTLAKKAREREGRRVETATIEGAGHDGLLDRKETIEAIRRFLVTVSSQ